MRTKVEIKKAIQFFDLDDWPGSIVRSVALRVTLRQSPEECNNILENTLQGSAAKHGALLVSEVRRLRRELRKQIKGNQRLSRALGLIKEYEGPIPDKKQPVKEKGQEKDDACLWEFYPVHGHWFTACGVPVSQDCALGAATCPKCGKRIKFDRPQGVTVSTHPGPPGWGQIVVTAPPGMTVAKDIARSLEELRKTSEKLRQASAELSDEEKS